MKNPHFDEIVRQAWHHELEDRGFVGLLCENTDFDNPFGPRFWEPQGGSYKRVPFAHTKDIKFGGFRGRVTHVGVFDTFLPRTGILLELARLDIPRGPNEHQDLLLDITQHVS